MRITFSLQGRIFILDRQVARKPRLVGGVRGTIKTIFSFREAPACGRGASLCLYFTKVSFWPQTLFPWKRRNICAVTPWIPDWNISILWKLVNRNFQNFQKERVKEVGCLFHLLICNRGMLQESKISDWNHQAGSIYENQIHTFWAVLKTAHL